MKITYELNLRNFKAWNGAVNTLNNIIEEDKIDLLEGILEDHYEELTETQLNDILWFDTEWIYNVLNMEDYLD